MSYFFPLKVEKLADEDTSEKHSCFTETLALHEVKLSLCF